MPGRRPDPDRQNGVPANLTSRKLHKTNQNARSTHYEYQFSAFGRRIRPDLELERPRLDFGQYRERQHGGLQARLGRLHAAL
jgi:hypothetical protein